HGQPAVCGSDASRRAYACGARSPGNLRCGTYTTLSTLSRDQVLALIRQRADHPATAQELLQVLRVPRQERSTLRRHLKALVASGDLIKIRGNRFGLADRMDVVVGRLETH